MGIFPPRAMALDLGLDGEQGTLAVAEAPIGHVAALTDPPVEERRDPRLKQLIDRQPEKGGQFVQTPHLKPGPFAVEELVEGGSVLEAEAFCQQRLGFLAGHE